MTSLPVLFPQSEVAPRKLLFSPLVFNPDGLVGNTTNVLYRSTGQLRIGHSSLLRAHSWPAQAHSYITCAMAFSEGGIHLYKFLDRIAGGNSSAMLPAIWSVLHLCFQPFHVSFFIELILGEWGQLSLLGQLHCYLAHSAWNSLNSFPGCCLL